MAIILPPEHKFGDLLGDSLGSGLGSVLKGLSSGASKQGLAEIFGQQGLPPALAYMPEQVQAAYLKQFGAAQQMAQAQNAEAGAQDIIGEIERFASGANQNQEPLGLQNANATGQGSQQFQSKLPGQFLSQGPAEGEDLSHPLKAPGIEPPVFDKEFNELQNQIQRNPESVIAKRIAKAQERLANPNIPNSQKVKIGEYVEKQQKELSKRRDRLYDRNEKLINEITDEQKDSQEIINSVDRQLELIEKGDMDSAGYLQFLDSIGMGGIDALKNADTQEFIKSNSPFMKNLKKWFGGNVSNTQVEQLKKFIASEYQSPEGQRRIALTLRNVAEAANVRGNTLDKIIKANSDMPTENLKRDIEKIAQPILKRARKKLLFDIKRNQKKAPSFLSTAGPALGGKGLSAIGQGVSKVIPGAIGGALLGGATAGPGGALTGALQGALRGGALSAGGSFLKNLLF